MKCRLCGAENPDTARFCTDCGASLQEEQADFVSGISDEELTAAEEAVNEAASELSQAADISEAAGQTFDDLYEADATGGYTTSGYEEYGGEYEDEITNGYIGFAIGSLVCGCLSIFCCFLACLSAPISIAGIILGGVTLFKKYDGRGLAIAGIVTAGVGLVLQVVVTVVYSTGAGGIF